MENEVIKKRGLGRFIAIILAACLLVGSALAITPVVQRYTMPDPYGVMPLALASHDSRIIVTSDRIGYGPYYDTSEGEVLPAGEYSVSSGETVNLSSFEQYEHGYGGFLSIPSGTMVDYIADLFVSSSVYSSVIVSGSFLFEFEVNSKSLYLYSAPSSVQLLINGLPVGPVLSVVEDKATVFSDIQIDLTGDVETIGVRCLYDDEVYLISSEESVDFDYYLNAFVKDNLSVIPSTSSGGDTDGGDTGGGDTGGDDTGGDTGGGSTGGSSGSVTDTQIYQVISWQQNTFNEVTEINSQLDPNNSGSTGSYIKQSAEDTSNIASIFAREDDIKLRDDMDSTLKEATSSFWSPAGEGETETEFDKATKIDKQKVTDIKNVGKGASALFDTGYDITDGFEAIATDDSFMSWFTAETANALDSTGQAMTVGEDDPYNMHFYYDQMQAIQNARGDD